MHFTWSKTQRLRSFGHPRLSAPLGTSRMPQDDTALLSALGLGFVLLEPAGYVQHFGDVVARAAADAVGLFRDADQHGVDVEKFQGGVKLLGLGDGGAVVGFAG